MKKPISHAVCFLWLFLFSFPILAKDDPPPLVILISVDTLAARHMSLHGYGRATTPFIDSFAKQNIYFENAQSAAAYTLPSHFSMFTGTYPHTHGVELGRPERDKVNLSSEIWTLPQYLKDAGYRTYWFASEANYQLDLERGLGRSIDEIQPYGRLHSIVRSERARKKFLEAIPKIKSQPSFLFFHTSWVHGPYKPSPPFDTIFNPSDKKKRMQTAAEVTGNSPNQPIEMSEGAYRKQFDFSSQADRTQFEALYDGGIRTFDDIFRSFIDILKEQGVYENAVIILTSDHAEAFGSHGHFNHEEPYADEIHIPLIVKLPNRPARKISEPVSSVDIVPTVLDFLKLKKRSNIDGESLLPLIDGKKMNSERYLFSAGYRSQAVFDSKWKLIAHTNGQEKLFQIDIDPNEKSDVSQQHSGEVLRLRSALAAANANKKFGSDVADAKGPAQKLFWFIPDGMRADRGDFNIFQWAQEGKLPNLRRMMREGTFGYSIPEFPSHTPINYASLLTGAHPSAHGISDGPMHAEGVPLAKPSASGFASTSKRVPPIWKTMEAVDKRVFLLSVPGSTPPEIKETTVRGRWGGWGADTFSIVFESKDMLAKRKANGRSFRLFFLGEQLTKFVTTNKASNGSIEASLDAHGLSIKAKVEKASKNKYSKMRFELGSKQFALKQGEWTDWVPVMLNYKGADFSSNVRLKLVKLWPNGNFRVRALFDGLNRLNTEPSSAADILSESLGPMVDFLDNWPPQLVFEPEDRDLAREEIRMSLAWHRTAVPVVMNRFNPDVFIQSIYTPNQMLESRWWHSDIDKSRKSFSSKKSKESWQDILEMYQGLDSILGEALYRAARKNMLVVLSSDHGVCPLHRLVHLNNVFAKKGWLKFSINPETGESEIDWKNTKVVYLKMLHVYINPDGLAGDWKRSSGAEYEKLRNEVIQTLGDLKDTDGTRPLVRAVKWEDANKTYDLPLDRVGDLILETKVKYFWYEDVDKSLVSFSDPLTSGYKQSLDPLRNECMWTPFVVWGPGVRKGFELKEPIAHVDQLPTLLKLMNQPIPAHVQGKVLTDALDRAN